jgi:hypothetical protein
MTIISRNTHASLSREYHFSKSERQARSVFPADYKKSAELVEFQILDLWSPLFSTRSMVRDYAEQQNSSCCATAG